MIRQIVKWPSKTLKQVSEPVVDFGPALQELVNDLLDTMYEANGLGLSAIQIGVPRRVFVLDVGPRAEVYVNPMWTPATGAKRVYMNEGCLSVPGVYERVLRYPVIDVSYHVVGGTQHDNTEWSWIDHPDIQRLRAQVIQHESDHLDGKIFMDQLHSWQRERIKKQLKRGMVKV